MRSLKGIKPAMEVKFLFGQNHISHGLKVAKESET